jgi:hypothetical protein
MSMHPVIGPVACEQILQAGICYRGANGRERPGRLWMSSGKLEEIPALTPMHFSL